VGAKLGLSAANLVIAALLCTFNSSSGEAAGSASSANILDPLTQPSVSRLIVSRSMNRVPACQLQNGKKLPALRYRAVGTEPFWDAEIVGRCITYLAPDMQKGARIWTHYMSRSQSKKWVGSYKGRKFELRLSKARASRCSDGMSDKNYPLNSTLQVAGDTRRGCAEPR
jgi:uncharacterized membrane protein